jgi:hypothetical protein
MPHDANHPNDPPDRQLPGDLAEVLVDVKAVRSHVAALGGRLALTVPRGRRAVCVQLVAIVGDMVDPVDDTASGNATHWLL